MHWRFQDLIVPGPGTNGGAVHTENLDKNLQHKTHGLCVPKKEWSGQGLRRTTRRELHAAALEFSTLTVALGKRTVGRTENHLVKILNIFSFSFLTYFPDYSLPLPPLQLQFSRSNQTN